MTESMAERIVEDAGPFYDALERGDVEAAMEVIADTIHPECEFTSAIGSEVDGRTYRGPEAMRSWFTDLIATFEVRYEERRFRAIGDENVLFLTKNRLRGKGSGAEVIREIGVVYETEDGLVRKVVSYRSHGEAIAAAEALEGVDA